MKVILFSRYVLERRRCSEDYFAPEPGAYAAYAVYLEVFEEVVLLASYVDSSGGLPENAHKIVNGPRLKIIGFPNRGESSWQNYFKMKRWISAVCKEQATPDAVFVAQENASRGSVLMLEYAQRNNIPYAIRVIADPYAYFSKEAYRGPFRSLLQQYYGNSQKRYCKKAAVAFYVTEDFLQKRYPTQGVGFAVADVILKEEDFFTTRTINKSTELLLLWVGNYIQKTKGALILLKALLIAKNAGYHFKLVLIGNDGSFKEECIAFVLKHNLQEMVNFLPGMQHSPEYFNNFLAADLFVHPSFHEGLSRVLLEAMARGLPCVGFNTGGVGEILAQEDIVYQKNAGALAKKIMIIADDPLQREKMSKQNIMTARRYRDDVLREKFRTGLRFFRDSAEMVYLRNL